MVIPIDELKKIIQDKMILKKAGNEIQISRAANNIIRIYGRLVTWGDLQDMLANGEYDLILDGQKVMDKKNSDWGGARLPGPGKKLGPPKKDPAKKKKPITFSLSPETIDKLDILCGKTGVKRSALIEAWINEKI